MNRGALFLIIPLLAVSILPMMVSDADAAAQDPDHYCYSHDLVFYYTGGTTDVDSVTWEVTGYLPDGSTREVRLDPAVPDASDSWTVNTVPEDVEGCEYIDVKQTVSKGTNVIDETWRIVIIAPPVDSYDVMFYDGFTGQCLKTQELDGNTIIDFGDDFATAPAAPSRDDYDFLGWFYSDLVTPFDPKRPVEADTSVYARWAYTGGSSGGGSTVVVGSSIVTFQASPGLQYTILEAGQSSVRFTVYAVDGPVTADMSTLEVASDNGSYVVLSGGIWTLAEVHDDVIVTLSAELVDTQKHGGFPWWMVAFIVVIVISCGALMYYRLKDKE